LIEVGDLSEDILVAVESKGRVSAPGRSIRDMEIDAIRRLLKEHRGDTAKVSSILGIDRSTLYRKIKRYNINWT
jgi:transcriptional regulator of acetoin/glycerol metabolism